MPVDRDALQARLRALFVDELGENVVVLNRGFVALEQSSPDGDAGAVVNEMFRAAHSLKGAAHSAGVDALVTLCHHLEDALSRLRDGSLPSSADVIEPLLQAVDALDAAGRRMADGGDAAGDDVNDAGRRLAVLVARPPEAPAEAAAEAPPAVPSESRPEPSTEAPSEVEAPDERGAIVAPRREPNIRVSPERLDTLLNQAGELLHACRRVDVLAENLSEAAGAARSRSRPTTDQLLSSKEMGDRLDRLARDAISASRLVTALGAGLAHDVRQVRMVPLENAYEGLERVVRDLASAGGKEVRLELRGGKVEVDRPILEAVSEAVLHLVRNAIDHGIEAPEERTAAAKPASGRLVIDATLVPEGVAVTVVDDGRGLDLVALREAARRRGITASDDDAGLVEVAFLPGVSTSTMVTQVSGRGVGLDAVRARVESLGGSVTLQSNGPDEGGGCTSKLSLPLTLATVRIVLVRVAGEILALPSAAVSRLLMVAADDLRPVDDGTSILLDGRRVPVLMLGEVLGFSAAATTASPPFSGVLTGAPHEAVLVVDELMGEEEAVMKPVGHGIATLPGVLGATVIQTGGVALLLNPATCVRKGMAKGAARIISPDTEPLETGPRGRVLLAEDTITTRALERSILEAAGYDVLVAVDGLEAWQLLEAHGADAVVSDVDMPRMNGIALCEATRRSPRFRDIPFILVTSLASDVDRRRGVDAGASAYLVKADFDQALLLETLERLL